MSGGPIVTAVRISDGTPDQIVREVIEARVRRLMAERARLPQWGDGRRERKRLLVDIDDSLDEWLLLQ